MYWESNIPVDASSLSTHEEQQKLLTRICHAINDGYLPGEESKGGVSIVLNHTITPPLKPEHALDFPELDIHAAMAAYNENHLPGYDALALSHRELSATAPIIIH